MGGGDERAVAVTADGNVSPGTRVGFYAETRSLFGGRYKAHLSPRVEKYRTEPAIMPPTPSVVALVGPCRRM